MIFVFTRRLRAAGWKKVKNHLKLLVTAKNVAVAMIIFALFVFSLGSHIKIADQVLFIWPLSDVIEKLWLMFRSSARVFWPIYYLIILGVLVFFIKHFKGRKSVHLVLFLLPFIVIQLVDIQLSPAVNIKKDFAHNATCSQTDANRTVGELIIKNGSLCNKKHLISLSPYLYIDEFIDFSKAAVSCDMTMTEGYYAHHYRQQDIRDFITKEKMKIVQGEADFKNNLYLTTDEKFIKDINGRYEVQKIKYWYVIKG